jgi:hypothetical protein
MIGLHNGLVGFDEFRLCELGLLHAIVVGMAESRVGQQGIVS